MGLPRALAIASLPFLVGCATSPEASQADYMDAGWIVGRWRIDSYIRAGAQTRDIRLELTFLPDGWVEVNDETSSSHLTSRCRWYPRVSWVDTGCAGTGLRIRNSSNGPLEVELTGTVPVPYYVEECVSWRVDANGNRYCGSFRQVERFRYVSARGQAILEPSS